MFLDDPFTDEILVRIPKGWQDLRAFVWRCAVYALPFLGSPARFLWGSGSTQSRLYDIFRALDYVADTHYTSSGEYADWAYRNFMDEAVGADKAARDHINAAIATGLDAISYAVIAAIYSAYACAKYIDAGCAASSYSRYLDEEVGSCGYREIELFDKNSDKAKHSAISAAVFSACYAKFAAKHYSMAYYGDTTSVNLESIILQDVKGLQGEKEPHISIDFYGNAWDIFQQKLKNKDCIYWGKLYNSIFDNGFTMDQKALARRLNVPQEIEAQGATAVAHFLEETEEKR